MLQCSKACVGGLLLNGILSGCGTMTSVPAQISGDNLVVALSEFVISNAEGNSFKSQLVVHPKQLSYPIAIFRFSALEYVALWMRCSHQGAELEVFGDKLQCPAHGSEFDKRGVAESGPAIESLRRFPVTITDTELFISLKAV
ncbi:MAG: Rieske (2Fe-2S) protein [Saprospiraceae bacterium]